MKDYYYYEAEDFVEDENFRRWVFEKSPEENDFWAHWLFLHPEKGETVDAAREMLMAIRGEQQSLTDDWIDGKVAQLLACAQDSPSPKEQVSFLLQTLTQNWLKVAASLVLLAGIGWGVYQYHPGNLLDHSQYQSSGLVLVANTTGTPRRITLPDGSQVTLQKNSNLTYPPSFNLTQREVTLHGEAFFQVARDPSKPFMVYANGLVAKVLGTSFNVSAYSEDKKVTVTVKTGKVSVFAQSDKELSHQKESRNLSGMILKPNQKVTFLKPETRLIRSLVEQPDLISVPKANQQFIFDRTPISEVFKTLEQAYGITIVFDEELMAACTLTASLGEESLFNKLELICAGTESSYQLVDGQILITSKGCQ
jgi:ferric-dicitrate binding protein FerR (iron transport regulator)